MSISQIKKLERERDALSKKIAAERGKLAAKLGGDLIRALGEEAAAAMVEQIAEKVKAQSAKAILAALGVEADGGSASERPSGASEPVRGTVAP